MAVERVGGVRKAEFAYPEGKGVVTYDTTVTSDSAIVAELGGATGFEAIVRPAAPTGSPMR